MKFDDSLLSPTVARQENRQEHEKFDARLRRLELAVLALGLMAAGSGAGNILARLFP